MLIAPAFHLFKDTLAQDSPGFAQRFFHAPSPCWGHTCLSCILSPPAFRVFLHWMRLQKNGAHPRLLGVLQILTLLANGLKGQSSKVRKARLGGCLSHLPLKEAHDIHSN